MRILFTVFFLLFCTNICLSQEHISINKLTIGEEHTIFSNELNENRLLNVYLPHDYDDKKPYPVIYVLDGSIHEDFMHAVGLVQFFNLQFKMPSCIVVGVANVDRKRDFTFHTDIEDLKKEYPTTGHSDKFIRFMKHELLPYVSARFRTNKENYILGQSLGGLLATEILLNHTNMFSHYFIVSPSLWWDDESLLLDKSNFKDLSVEKKTFVYLAIGGKEHPVMVKDAVTMSTYLQSIESKNLDFYFNFMKEEDHATILHNAFYQGLQVLFPHM